MLVIEEADFTDAEKRSTSRTRPGYLMIHFHFLQSNESHMYSIERLRLLCYSPPMPHGRIIQDSNRATRRGQALTSLFGSLCKR